MNTTITALTIFIIQYMYSTFIYQTGLTLAICSLKLI